MLIIISAGHYLKNESLIINQLLEKGLEIFHLRKPNSSKKKYENLLNGIDSCFRNRIAIHQYHELAEKYGIQRIHVPEYIRTIGRYSRKQALSKYTFSTSIHDISTFEKINSNFNYAFIGPVFPSISKKNYDVKVADVLNISKKRNCKLIALGGIHEGNCNQVISKGFDGVALCGTIWSSENPMQHFNKIKEKWIMTDQ